MAEDILTVSGLKVYFPIKGELIPKVVGNVKAVDGVDFQVKRGETLGLVGRAAAANPPRPGPSSGWWRLPPVPLFLKEKTFLL